MLCLVTGGAGFIGSHLAERLCGAGHSVRILDDFSTGSLANLGWRERGHRIEIIEGSVADENVAAKAARDCDWVFHLAAQPSVPASVAQPYATHEINLSATLRLLIAARDAQARRFVFGSSSAVYGDAGAGPIRESHPVNPLSPYGLHKFAGESYARLFFQLYGLPTVSLRFFNVFGPRQSFSSPYSGVVAKFCVAALNGGRPFIFGDGRQSRDFVFVQDAIDALMRAAETSNARVFGRSFNIGAGESVTLLELLKTLEEISGRRLDPIFAAARAGDIRNSRADVALADELLGFKAAVGLAEGLSRTLEFYRAGRGQPAAPRVE